MNFLIVANGPFQAKFLIKEAAQNKRIIALDGACIKLAKMGILPHVILGDFDSIDPQAAEYFGIKENFAAITESSQSYQGLHQVTIVPAKNQDLTDLAKAIQYCDNQGATSINIICASGGRTDHNLGNLRVLRTQYRKNRPIYIHTDRESISFALDQRVWLKGEIDEYCAVLGFPSAKFSSQGLKYNGEHYSLELGHDSICNQLSSKKAYVDIEGEALIISPGQYSAQRAFLKLSYSEQLQLLKDENLNGHSLQPFDNYSFYISFFAGIALVSSLALLVIGVVLSKPLLIAAGAIMILGSGIGLHGFFSQSFDKSKQSNDDLRNASNRSLSN